MIASVLRLPVDWFRRSTMLRGLEMFLQRLEFLNRQLENSVPSARYRTPVWDLPVWDFLV